MVWEPKQCCCCGIRVGTLVIGWLGLIGSVLHLLSTMKYVVVTHDDIVKACVAIVNSTDTPQQSQYFDPADCPTVASVAIACLAISGVLTGMSVIICSMLLYGINKNKPKFMVPYLVVRAIGIAILLAFEVFLVIFMMYLGTFLGAFIFAIIFGLLTFLDVYFFLVTRVCYMEVKTLSGDSEVPYMQHQDTSYKI